MSVDLKVRGGGVGSTYWYIDTKSHAFGVRLTLFDPISRNHAIQTKYHSFFLNTTTRGKFFNWDGDER